MAAAILFFDPLLAFYPSQSFPTRIQVTMPSSNTNDSTVFCSSRGRETPTNGSRAEHIFSSVQSDPLSDHTPNVDPVPSPNYRVSHFDQDIEADVRERVFVHADDFFSTVLHLSPDWKMDGDMTKKIQAMRGNQRMQTYAALCNKTEPGENSFYDPYSVMCNSAPDVSNATDDSGLGIHNDRQDVKVVLGSKETNVPDTLAVLRAMFASSGNEVDEMKDSGPEDNISCVQTMYWQELQPKVTFLDEGTDARHRVLSDAGEDPRGDVGSKPIIHRDPESISVPARPLRLGSTSKKRRSREEVPHASKYARCRTTFDVSETRNRSENSTALVTEGAIAVAEMEEVTQSEARRKTIVRSGRYALEILSSAGLRTHCIGALVTMGRIQLLYYDRSIVIVCKPIEMFDRGPGASEKNILPEITDEFGALIIALGRLTPKQRGIQKQICPDWALIENYERYMQGCGKDGGEFDQRDIFKGVTLSLKLNLAKSDEVVEVTLGRIISRYPAIVGRHTCVVDAKSDRKEWKGKELVIKISWPAIERQSEAELVAIAREKARMMKIGKKPDWALDHLPDILLCQDFGHDADSTQGDIAAFCKNAKCANNETIDYEHRVCRITVQERLYPLEELWTVEEYAQVFLDILQIHKWLYDHPRILHRDISPGNIMWRRTSDGHVRGVLNDFDLSSSRDFHGASSLQRTGTLPYMASELLIDKNGQPPKHLYRHDVESIFYVILLLCCRYQVVPPPSSSETAPLTYEKVSSQFDEWYNLDRATLKKAKVAFIVGDTTVVNSGFAAFQPWLTDLHGQFSEGQSALSSYSHRQARGKATGAFDEETLQNQISYLIVLDICSEFAGSPLVVRNDQVEVAVQ